MMVEGPEVPWSGEGIQVPTWEEVEAGAPTGAIPFARWSGMMRDGVPLASWAAEGFRRLTSENVSDNRSGRTDFTDQDEDEGNGGNRQNLSGECGSATVRGFFSPGLSA